MKRLIDETNDPIERELLREGRDYRASRRARDLAVAAVLRPAWAKSIGLKIAIGVVAIGAAGFLFLRSNESTTITNPPKPTATEAPTQAIEEPAKTVVDPIAPTPPAVTAPTTVTVPRVVPPTIKPAPRSTLGDEIAVIDRARNAVYTSDKAGAIRALDEYDQRFPNGAMSPEAKALRVRANALP